MLLFKKTGEIVSFKRKYKMNAAVKMIFIKFNYHSFTGKKIFSESDPEIGDTGHQENGRRMRHRRRKTGKVFISYKVEAKVYLGSESTKGYLLQYLINMLIYIVFILEG